jgi:phage terminase large subunit-like protein
MSDAFDPVATLEYIQQLRAFLRDQLASHTQEEFFIWLDAQEPEDKVLVHRLMSEPAFTLSDHQLLPIVTEQSYQVHPQERILSFQQWREQPRVSMFDKHGKPVVWRKTFMRMGRGSGKTHAGSANCHDFARYLYPGLTGMLVGPDHKHVREVMIEGSSGLLSTAPPDFVPVYKPMYSRVEWPNGSRAIIYTSDDPEAIRGPSMYWAWGDELAKWKDERSYKNLNRTLRNKHPAGNRMILTTSPISSQKWVREIEAQPDTITIVASSFDNTEGLDATALADWEREVETGSKTAREEYYAEWQDEQDKLWTVQELDLLVHDKRQAITLKDIIAKMDSLLLTIDPGGKRDYTGIILLGRQGDRYWVLADWSMLGPKSKWLAVVAGIRKDYMRDGDRILVETNVHNDADEDIRAVCPGVYVEAKHQSSHTGSKEARAQRAQLLYEDNKVVHFRVLPELHQQMENFYEVVAAKNQSPDRVDALVNGLNWYQDNKKRSFEGWTVGPSKFNY